jgi:hypothetical protein
MTKKCNELLLILYSQYFIIIQNVQKYPVRINTFSSYFIQVLNITTTINKLDSNYPFYMKNRYLYINIQLCR